MTVFREGAALATSDDASLVHVLEERCAKLEALLEESVAEIAGLRRLNEEYIEERNTLIVNLVSLKRVDLEEQNFRAEVGYLVVPPNSPVAARRVSFVAIPDSVHVPSDPLTPRDCVYAPAPVE